MARDITQPDPSAILELVVAFRRSKTMFAAVSLGVFDELALGPKSVAGLAARFGASPQALTRLLNACVSLGLLVHHDDKYINTPTTNMYLTCDSPHRLTGYIKYSNDVLWNLWTHLEDGVREGTHRWQQTYGWDGPIFSHFFRTENDKREFLMGMHGFGVISSPHVVEAFDLSRFQRLVDLGGATGHLAIAASDRYPGLNSVVFDLPEVVPLAREIVGLAALSDRIDVQPGDFFSDPLPPADLYALGRILHDWNEDKVLALLARIHASLPTEGAVLIAEKLLDDNQNGQIWAHMQNLNMLICTEGKERTLAEYEALLQQAGFSQVVGCRTPSPLDAILAFKR